MSFENLDRVSTADPFHEGAQARAAGKAKSANPYGPDGTDEAPDNWHAWREGWDRENAQINAQHRAEIADLYGDEAADYL